MKPPLKIQFFKAAIYKPTEQKRNSQGFRLQITIMLYTFYKRTGSLFSKNLWKEVRMFFAREERSPAFLIPLKVRLTLEERVRSL